MSKREEKSEDRRWPGYEPLKGKKPTQQGSCRPKAKSKLTASEQKFRTKRKRQLDRWEREHPGKSRAAARHLKGPSTEK